MENNILLSIIILTWNGEAVIGKNLDSIFAGLLPEPFEIIVVDNGSTDDTLEILERYSERIKLIKNGKNLGFTKGNNVGIEAASGKYVLLLNQDVEQIDSAIQMMVNFLEKSPAYGAVAPRLVYPNGRIQKSCRPFYTWKNLFIDYFTFGSHRKNFYNHNENQDVDQPMASVLMIRKLVLDKIGNFDERRNFWLYFSDVDLSYRIFEAGYRHYLLADAKFFHHHGQSARKFFNLKRLWEYHRGLYGFFMKYHISSKFSLKYLVFVILLLSSYILMNIKEFGITLFKTVSSFRA